MRSQSTTWAVWAIVLALAVVGGIFLLPPDALSGDLARLLLVCGSVMVALMIVNRGRSTETRERAISRSALVLWWFLLCSETFFPRANNGAENAAAGRFSLTAYSEAIFWIFLAVCFLFIAAPRLSRMKYVVRGRLVILYAIAGLCALSIMWAPEPMFSAAWAFKLLLGVSMALFCVSSMQSLRDLRTLMVVTCWAFAFLTVVPVVEGTLNPASSFSGTAYAGESVVEQGRFHSTAHPLTIAGRAGILALIALLFYSLERKRKMLVIALACAVVIGLAGAKTAFLAATISVGLFFSLRRRVMAGFGLVIGLGLLALLIVSTTAVGGYLRDYLQRGDLMTISGRTDLWSAAWPEIMSHLALGHGYVASKLVSLQVGIPWYAGHMHNAILETLYNNGLLGLLLLLAVNLFITANLVSLYRRSSRREIRQVAISLLALYCFLFLNGITEPYFGGQASAFYLLIIALFGITEWLRVFSVAVARVPVAIQTRREVIHAA